MGYRHYFFKANKTDVEMTRDLSYSELKRKFGDDTCYIDLDNIIKHENVFCFGKLYWEDTAEQIYNTGKPLFNDEECMKEFEDYIPYEVGKDGLLKAIEIYRNKVIKYLESLQVDKTDEWTNKEEKSVDKIKKDVKDRLFLWKNCRTLNLDEEDKTSITDVWLYEYSIFNLVYLLKTIDWKTETLLFYGC